MSAAASSGLNFDRNFDTYCVGEDNRFAVAAALAVAEVTSFATYNPLVICGRMGTGKTHLLHAVGNLVEKSLSDAVVRYQIADEWCYSFTEVVDKRDTQGFVARARQMQLLLLDDVEFLRPFRKVQEEFVHFLRAIVPHSAVVIASALPLTNFGCCARSERRSEGR